MAEPSLDVLEQALSAVADLDRAVNGGAAPRDAEVVLARELIEPLVLRWGGLIGSAELRFRWGAGEARVLVDPVRLRGALENLIANAHEHGRSPITVTASTIPGGVRIAVGDGGPAVRLGPSPRRDRRRGHGLTNAAEFAAAHGGALRSWQAPDGGTVVAIDLPLAPPRHPAAPLGQRRAAARGRAPTSADGRAPTSADGRAPAAADARAPTSADARAPTSADAAAPASATRIA